MKKYIFLITIIFGIVLDLYIKNLANIYMQNKINILGDLLYFEYTLNSGIAFSVQLPIFLLKIITISLIILIFYYYLKEERKKKSILIDFSFGLILAGAIGNGIERIINENVIDFIGMKYFSIFNLADSFIFIGVSLYLYTYFRNKKFNL